MYFFARQASRILIVVSICGLSKSAYFFSDHSDFDLLLIKNQKNSASNFINFSNFSNIPNFPNFLDFPNSSNFSNYLNI